MRLNASLLLLGGVVSSVSAFPSPTSPVDGDLGWNVRHAAHAGPAAIKMVLLNEKLKKKERKHSLGRFDR